MSKRELFDVPPGIRSGNTGDMYYRDSGGTLQSIPVGTAGQVLAVTTSTSTPIAFQTSAGGSAVTVAGDMAASTSAGTVTVSHSLVVGTGLTKTTSTASPATATVALTVPVVLANGGTGIATATTGDILYVASATATAFSKLAIGTVGQVLRVSGGLPVWSTPAEGDTGTFTYFDPDAPPSSPSADDDEFNGTSLSGSWTQVNWSGLTYDQDTTLPGGLRVTVTTSASTTKRCLLKALPAGDFTIQTAVIGSTKLGGTAQHMGLVVSTHNTAGTGTQYTGVLVETGNGWDRFAQTRTNFTTAVSTEYGADPWRQQSAYIQIVRSGSNLQVKFSHDGRTWFGTGTLTAWTASIAYMGLLLENNGSVNLNASFLHFRYSATANALFGRNRTVVGA